jgi:hypothetical protein
MATRNTKAKSIKAPQEKPFVVSVKDKFENEIISEQLPHIITLYLALKEEKYRKRMVGSIFPKQRIFEVKRERNKHLFLKLNAYGFNYHILSNAQLFDLIVLRDEYSTWRIPREYILENGQIMNFKNNGGFELQIFIPLEQINQFSTRANF